MSHRHVTEEGEGGYLVEGGVPLHVSAPRLSVTSPNRLREEWAATRLRHWAKNSREFNDRRRPVTPKVAGSSPVAPASKINILAHLFARFSTPPNGSLGSSERPCSELFLSTRSFHACNLAAGIRMRSGRAEAARILHSEVRCRGGYRDHAHRLACAGLCTALRDRSQVSSANPLEIWGKSARSRLARNRRMGGMFLR